MIFKVNNLVRMITDAGDGEVMCVVTDSNELTGITECYVGADMENADLDTKDLELVTAEQIIRERQKSPQPIQEQTIAIVSFEGAIKREVKAVREALKMCDTIADFTLTVKASGPTNSGEVEICYEIEGSRYGDGVTGDTIRECLAEFMRRHGWDNVHKPKAISYDGIPF